MIFRVSHISHGYLPDPRPWSAFGEATATRPIGRVDHRPTRSRARFWKYLIMRTAHECAECALHVHECRSRANRPGRIRSKGSDAGVRLCLGGSVTWQNRPRRVRSAEASCGICSRHEKRFPSKPMHIILLASSSRDGESFPRFGSIFGNDLHPRTSNDSFYSTQ